MPPMVLAAATSWFVRLPAQDADDIEKIEEAARRLTGIDIAIAVGALVLAWPLAMACSWVARKLIRRLPGDRERLAQAVDSTIKVTVVFIGVAIALSRFGLDVGWFTVTIIFIAALLFLMLRPLLENFAAGLLLETRTSYSLGDEIETNGHLGEVIEVNDRATVLLTRDQRRVHIPSTEVLKNVLVVYTGIRPRRSTIVLEVDRSLDLDHVIAVLVQAAASADGVLDDPAPSVRARGIGDATVELHLRWWHGPRLTDESRAKDAVIRKLVAVLPVEGVTIPAPLMLIEDITQAD